MTAKRWLIVAGALGLAGLTLMVVVLVMYRPTSVPDVLGQPVAKATTLVEQAGLRLGTQSRVATTAVGVGFVLEQRPAGSESAPRGSAVDVTLAVTPAWVSVPAVTGLDQAAAEQKLTSALFAPIHVQVFTTKAAKGTVVDQAPAAGTTYQTGRGVAIGVSAGPDDGSGVTVPDLSGMTVTEATSALAKVGLRSSGFVTDITTPQTNVVVDQLPDKGVIVGKGTTVLLLFENR